MQPAVPSRTALRVALRRAAHQICDARPLILDDPIAVPILGPYASELRRTPGSGHHRRPAQRDLSHSVGLRASLVARSRYAEDLLAEAVAGGVSQYVLLGAGLDTFAHRNPHRDLRVFEADYSATQIWKRDLLELAGLPPPASLSYVPIDLETESLPEALRRAGHDSGRPSVFAWLGVVPYLTLEAFRSTLGFLAGQPRGSCVIFDYTLPRQALSGAERLAQDSLTERVRAAGEPFRLFFTPDEIRVELAAAGLTCKEDVGPPEVNARYFADRSDGLRLLGNSARLATVVV